MRRTIFTLAILALGLFPLATKAAEFRTADNNQAITVSDRVKNLFVAGQTVNITTPLFGDLFAGGSTVTIQEAVEHDAVVAGQSVIIDGPIGANAFIAGSTVDIRQQIGSDLFVAGRDVILNGAVLGDLFAAGSTLTVNGPISGNARLSGAVIAINNHIAGNVVIDGTPTLGPRAQIDGHLTYTADKQVNLNSTQVTGGVDWKRTPIHQPSDRTLNRLTSTLTWLSMLALFAIGWLVYRLFPTATRAVTTVILERPLPAFGWGLLFMLTGPIIILFLFATLFGALAAFGLLSLYLLLAALAVPVAAWTLGLWLDRLLKPAANPKPADYEQWYVFALGVVVMGILSFVPAIGWLIRCVIYLVGFGALILAIDHARGQLSKK